MATVSRESIGTLNDKITVKVNREDYYPPFEKALKQYSKEANIPGFRKGMVPAGMIKKMHGQAIYTEEVLRSVERELGGYLQQEKLNIFAQPLPLATEAPSLDMNQPEEYHFDFEVGLKPEVDIVPLNGEFSFTRHKVKVSDEDIDEEVKGLQRKSGKREEKEAVTVDEDILTLHFQQSDAEGQLTDGGIDREEPMALSFFAPGLRSQLLGKKKDDSLVVRLGDAFEDKELEWLAKEWKLEPEPPVADLYGKITLTKVEELIPRELDAAFFQEIFPQGGVETEGDLRSKIIEEHDGYWGHEANNRLDNEIFETLVHETPLELPAPFLKKWMQSEQADKLSEEELEEKYHQFDHQLRWTLITDKLIADNALSVSPEELREQAQRRLLSYFGGAQQFESAPWLQEYVEKMMADEKFVNETYQGLITSKLFDWLRSKAKITDQEVSKEEFIQLSSHNHHHHEHEHE